MPTNTANLPPLCLALLLLYPNPDFPHPSPIPQSLPLGFPLHERSLFILVLVAHPPPRARSLPVDPPTSRRAPAPNLPHHRPRLPLLLSGHPLRIPRLALSRVLVYLRSFGG